MRNFAIAVLLVITAAVFFSAIAFTSGAPTQNANSSTTTNRNQNQNDSRQITPPAADRGSQPDFSKNTWELPADADRTKNPVPASEESIAKGKELYLAREKGNCVFCHGETGSGNAESLPRLRRKPADISNKERMSSMTDGEVFWKVTKGILGIMPAGEKRMTEEERWHVV